MSEPGQPVTPVHYLDLAIVGYEADVRVNGVRIDHADVRYPCLDTVPISEWLVEGSNAVRVRITRSRAHPDKDPKRTSEPDGRASRPCDLPPDDPRYPSRLRVRLCVGALGELVEPGRETVLHELDWRPPKPTVDWSLPHDVGFRYTLGGRPRFAFEDGDALDPADAPTADELYRFVTRVHDDLTRSDLDSFLQKQQLKFRELAPLYGKDAAEAARGTREAHQSEIAQGGWIVAPIDRAMMAFDAGFGGRVVEVLARDGKPLLRDGSGRKGWALHLYVARIDGQITIVR